MTTGAAVIGIGQSPFHPPGEASEYLCTVQAIQAALADAGLAAADVDGVTRFDGDAVWEFDLTAAVGVRDLAFYNAVPGGAGGAPSLLRMAVMAVELGLANVVLAYHGCNRTARVRYGPGMVGPPRDAAGRLGAGGEQYQVPLGIARRAEEAALIARRHMAEHDTTGEHLARVVMTLRRHAAGNPHALVRAPVDLDEYLAAPYVAEPLRTVDCAMDAAGAGCLVVAARDRAPDARHPPVRMLASMQVVTPPTSRHLGEWFDARSETMARGVRSLFARAGLGVADVDVAFLYDAFTPLVILGLEDFGFCRRGEGGPFVASGAIEWPDGRLPVNTNGGQLCEAHLDGINNLLEAVRQLRGQAGLQIEGADVALVAGSAMDPAGAVLLGR